MTTLPATLRCGYQVNPLGVAPERLRFSWVPGNGQRACQIQVTAADGRPHWDSGRLETPACTDLPYLGPEVTAGARYHWQVRTWDEGTEPSPWSEPAFFEVEFDGWEASWIGLGRIRTEIKPPTASGPCDAVAKALTPVPYLRREFEITKPVTQARLYVTARGLYEARLNGTKVGDGVLTPGWTDYAQRLQFQAYDVTSLLSEGANVFGALVADGWYSGFIGFDAKCPGALYGPAPEFLAQLVITLEDGGEQRIGTDGHWQAAFGAIRQADLLMGERHDLPAEPHGWDRQGFDASTWTPVKVRPRDDVKLVADPGPQVRITGQLPAVSLTKDKNGRYLADFGQNLTGWVRIACEGEEGAHLIIRHGEVLDAGGNLYTENLRSARQTDEYVTGTGAAVLEPRFTLHGFRYAEISGYPGELTREQLTAQVVHSDLRETGTFESSLPWLNQLFANIGWGQRGNFISVPTDCPQRDERLGWLGDAQIFARTASYNRDVAAFFAKWLDDVADAQLPSGAFPDIAPTLNLDWGGAPGWADGGVIIPWTLHRMYGDLGTAERHYGAMTRWMDFLERGNPDFIRSRDLGNSYNDWLAPGDDLTPPELLATAYWAYDAALMSELAAALGKTGDAEAYQALRAKIGAAFSGAFVAADGSVTSDTQTAYVLGLHMNLVPEDLRPATARHLVGAIERENWRLTTGFVGVGYLLPVLSSYGHLDAAYRLLGQDALPSWRYMIDHGATTIWERWDGWSEEHGFQSAWMNSFNHYALGSVGEWLYRFVLGIELAPGAAGFDRLLMRAHPGGGLDWARGSYESVRGRIASEWRREGSVFTWRVELPAGVSASVRVPSASAREVTSSNHQGPVLLAEFPGAPGVQEAVFEVGPGPHEFTGPALEARLCLT